MLYYINLETSKVIAREVGDEPFGDLWAEISEQEYQEALHPLSPSNNACSGLAVCTCSMSVHYDQYTIHYSGCPAYPANR